MALLAVHITRIVGDLIEFLNDEKEFINCLNKEMVLISYSCIITYGEINEILKHLTA